MTIFTFLATRSFEGLTGFNAFSEQTARLIDEEIRKLSLEALQRAREILLRHRAQVEALVARLLATEVVEEEDLRAILGPKVSAPPGLAPVDDGQASVEKAALPWGSSDA